MMIVDKIRERFAQEVTLEVEKAMTHCPSIDSHTKIPENMFDILGSSR